MASAGLKSASLYCARKTRYDLNHHPLLNQVQEMSTVVADPQHKIASAPSIRMRETAHKTASNNISTILSCQDGKLLTLVSSKPTTKKADPGYVSPVFKYTVHPVVGFRS